MAIAACAELNPSACMLFLKWFDVNFVNYSVYYWNSASVPAGGKCSCCLGDAGVGGCQAAFSACPEKGGKKMSWFFFFFWALWNLNSCDTFAYFLRVRLETVFAKCLLPSHSDEVSCLFCAYNQSYSLGLKMSGLDWCCWLVILIFIWVWICCLSGAL